VISSTSSRSPTSKACSTNKNSMDSKICLRRQQPGDHQGWGQGVLWPCIAKAMSMCMSCTLSAMQIDDDDHRRKGHSTEA
jgi:hypothetical protein